MDYLNISAKYFVIFGLANKKSVAAAIASTLIKQGGEVILVVRSKQRQETARKLFPQCPAFICDVEEEQQIVEVKKDIERWMQEHKVESLAGIVHSIAFANYSRGIKPFHETDRGDFLQAVNISCFSLISIANNFKDLLSSSGSVVTISISTTRMAATNYGYMAPVKAALDSSLCFLAKSFSEFSEIRFNAVAPSLLKTSASAGIPGYVDSYLFAEKAMLRKRALSTREAADTAVFLLSERASGINCQTVVVDGGMAVNYFDREIIGGTIDS
ncbi:MAG: enoyl-ACP reductase FabI [Desulfocapsaceae bacterium]